ncbi:MAG: sugar transferase [Clostridiales bacterium]|nr:sugar transferase [Clostridiales bacterium]
MAKRIQHSTYKPELNIVKKEHYEEFADIQPNRNPWYLFVKRTADIVCSFLALIVLSPLFLCVAIAIKSDGGPVFFKQKRVGKDCVEFDMYKFRSMVVNAEELLNDLEIKNEASGPVFKIKQDPRVTKVGRFIRRYSIDELPQLINILRGDMSIVGPRPPLPCEVEKYSDYDRQRLKVRPGLTCYWQCLGRSRISFEKWVDMDLEYINDQGIWCDFKMVMRTIPAVLKGDGAY